MRDLVSIVVPAFNRCGLIDRTIESVRAQTFANWQLIVVDDGSKDHTADMVAREAEKDVRIRLVRHDRNRGAQAARNTGIRAAKGEWIAFLDSDDYFLPNSLASRLEMARTANVQVVHSDGEQSVPGKRRERYGIPHLKGRVYLDLLRRPGTLFPSLLVSACALKQIGLLDETIVAWQEWDTSIRLSKYYEFGFVDAATFVYDCQSSNAMSKNPNSMYGYEQVVNKHAWAIVRTLGLSVLATEYEEAAMYYEQVRDAQSAGRCRRRSRMLHSLAQWRWRWSSKVRELQRHMVNGRRAP